MKIPYGVADLYPLRTRGHLYVDRTGTVKDRFAIGAEEAIYNPTLVLYFLKTIGDSGGGVGNGPGSSP